MKQPDKTVSTRKRPKREVDCLPPKQGLERLPDVLEPEPELERKVDKRVNINVNLQLTGNIQRCILAIGSVVGTLLAIFGFHVG